jgi:hypothetical protein
MSDSGGLEAAEASTLLTSLNLRVDSTLKIVVCVSCECGLKAKAVGWHLSIKHQVPGVPTKELDQELLRLGVKEIENETLDLYTKGPSLHPLRKIDGIKVEDGFQCGQCGHCGTTIDSVRHHACARPTTSASENQYRQVKIQTVFKKQGDRRYYAVETDPRCVGDVSENDILRHFNDSHSQITRAPAPKLNSREGPAFLIHVKFQNLLDTVDSANVHQLMMMPDPENRRGRISTLLLAYLKAIQEQAGDRNFMLRMVRNAKG